MRRGGTYSPSTEESHGEQGFWPSYADMMSAVALILFFLMLLSYISNLITGNNLHHTEDLKSAISMSRTPIAAMNKTVESFNSGVRDFSEFNYNLRGTVERMDVTVRDLVSGLREITRILERSSRS